VSVAVRRGLGQEVLFEHRVELELAVAGLLEEDRQPVLAALDDGVQSVAERKRVLNPFVQVSERG
jgi:hypothetical protein